MIPYGETVIITSNDVTMHGTVLMYDEADGWYLVRTPNGGRSWYPPTAIVSDRTGKAGWWDTDDMEPAEVLTDDQMPFELVLLGSILTVAAGVAALWLGIHLAAWLGSTW